MQEKLILVDPNITLLDPDANYQLKANLIPSFKRTVAQQKNLDKKILLKSWGGIGDMITAEPTIRYIVENLKEYKISLYSMAPDLYRHLDFHEVFDYYKDKIDESQYYVFNTMASDFNFEWEFISGLYTHCVDFASLIALRCQLPLKYKQIKIIPTSKHEEKISYLFKEKYKVKELKNCIVLHPGKHWQSKTFPKWWWDRVIKKIIKSDLIPIIIGGHADEFGSLRTTVDVNNNGCIDLRCELELLETVALLKRVDVLLTNDSSPLHLAAATNCWIGFIATCKHPDYITHYREGGFGWRMENLGNGGVWENSHFLSDLNVREVDEIKLLSWLPEPEKFAEWGINKIYLEEENRKSSSMMHIRYG